MHKRSDSKTITLLLLLVSFPIACVGQSPAPALVAPPTIQLAELKAPVTVRRDRRGIPYIEAATEDDLYFAQGFVTASDRLWQMDLLRRTARGELAEIFGRAVLEEDKRRRLYGFAQVTETTAARLPAETRRVLDQYARGVNAFINSRDAQTMPREFLILGYRPRPWTIADTLAAGKIFAEVLTRSWQSDVQRAAISDLAPEKRRALLQEDSPLDVLIVGADTPPARRASRVSPRPLAAPPAMMEHTRDTLAALSEIERVQRSTFERVGLYLEDFAASNNWVVGGKRTASGKPLLANDPHLPPSAPSVWYMTHLSLAPSANGARRLRVSGVTAPGAPGIIIGHNEQIAWGVTNFGPDVQDVFIETFDPQDKLRYRTPDGWAQATVRREEIKVRKGFGDASTETVPFEVTVTRHGPIVFEQASRRYALRWTALEASAEAELEAFYALNRAADWKDFQSALSRYTGPTQNFIYADRAGNIGYYAAGRIPIRRDGGGTLPYDGTMNAGDLTGFIPFAELPHTYNPPSGIIVTANNRLVGRTYKYFLGDEWAAPYRARRIYDLLQATPKHTTESFRRIQADTYSIGGAFFAREAAQLLSQIPASAQSANTNDSADKTSEAITLLKNWDGRVTGESRAAPLVAEMRASFRRRVLTNLLGETRAKDYRGANGENFIDRVITARSPEFLPAGSANYSELLRASLQDARIALSGRLGADETLWTWGRYSTIRFPHPLASVPFIGGQFVIKPLTGEGTGSQPGATPNVGAGVSMRFIADTNNWDTSQQGIALGESGDPTNPHWADQLNDWRAVMPAAFPFTTEAVKQATSETLVLKP